MTFYNFILSQIQEKLGNPDLTLEIPKEKSFGDFATNAAMQMAKAMGKNPRQIAESLGSKISELEFVDSVNVAGPGFINIKIKNSFIVDFINRDFRLMVPDFRLTICMDYGAYNVAKAMHIGHLRGSIVGDTLYRIARFIGHKPVSYNHLGDWGRPIATVIAWIIKKFPNDWNRPDFEIDCDALNNQYYVEGAAYAKENPEFLAEVLRIKKEFQDGHKEYFALYDKMMDISLAEMAKTVKRLNILPFDNNLGERNAAKYLDKVEAILREKNLLIESDGAMIIPLKRDTDTAPMPPFMFYDSRGADTYDSTDLATVYYRKITDNPTKIIYMSDARQNLHFEQLFRASEMSGIFPYGDMECMGYGSINGKDGKPLKTRDGTAVTLAGVLDMVDAAVNERVKDGKKNLSDDAIKMIALSALKFNDLMHDVKSDYIFDADIVTSFEGRTGPYVLYTAVRLNSALRKNEHVTHNISNVTDIYERDLLLKVLDFPKMIMAAFDKRAPDILANYTYDLCQTANAFYHNCPIKEDRNRAAIAKKTSEILTQCIDLMGLSVPEEM